MEQTKQIRARKLNKLLRYKSIMEEFDKHYNPDIPITTIYRKYIYPKFFISRETLYTIFKTPIDEELEELGYNSLVS